jgi:cell division protein FtsB
MKYGNKSLWKQISKSLIVLVALIIVFILMARATWKMYEKSSASGERLAQAAAALADLNKRAEALSEKVAYLSTEQGIESEIRTKFRAAREGESVAVIVDESQPSNETPASSTPAVLSWWEELLRLIGMQK